MISIEAYRIIANEYQLRELGLTVNVSYGDQFGSPWSAGVIQNVTLSYMRKGEFSPELLRYLRTSIQLSDAQIQELDEVAAYEPKP